MTPPLLGRDWEKMALGRAQKALADILPSRIAGLIDPQATLEGWSRSFLATWTLRTDSLVRRGLALRLRPDRLTH